MKKSAQDYLSKYAGGHARGGFNSRMQGYLWSQTMGEMSPGSDYAERSNGWRIADEMISEGEIFSTHNFHKPPHRREDCFAIPYGGTWVCNSCGNSNLNKPWWDIKVMADGNAFCCIGEDFVNLQESDCYAFGDTKKEAIENYGTLMAAA